MKFVVPDEFKYSGYCHCSDCRRFSGSSFSVFAAIPRAKLGFIEGEDKIGSYPKSEKSIMKFCNVCGSSLFVDKPKNQMVHLRLGVLDKAPSIKPQAHICVASKADWHEISDDLVQFEGLPPNA